MSWSRLGSRLLQLGKRLFPALISLGIVSWLVWSVTPQRLFQAFSTSRWHWLVLATVIQMVVLFCWDTVCLWWLFSRPAHLLPFWLVFRTRTDTIIWSAINLEIGQGAFAWQIARVLNIPLRNALGRFFLLAFIDASALLTLALVGSFIKPTQQTRPLRWICWTILGGMTLLILLIRFLPDHWKQQLSRRPLASWLAWLDWRDGCQLWLMRLVMFLLVLVYAGVGLAIYGLPSDPRTVMGLIPFVFMAEALPGTGGLGEREAALIYLLQASGRERAIVLSFGLIWSTVVIASRIGIGLLSLSLPHRRNSLPSAPGFAKEVRLAKTQAEAAAR